ncbi:MAG: hypothetical protein SNJ70_07380 [Armatimonadota bacterium]
MGNLTLGAFLMLMVAVTLGAFGQICIKTGLADGKIEIASTPFLTLLNIIHRASNFYVLLGLFLYVISTFFWLMVVSRVRLSVAYPLISISYILVVILSSLVLKEKVDWRFAGAGLFFIMIGVSFIGLGLGQMSQK